MPMNEIFAAWKSLFKQNIMMDNAKCAKIVAMF